MDQENVSAALTVAVPAARVFAVLADPAAHSSIDGTGWVQEAVDRAPLTEVGQIFRMDMYHSGHPEGDYQTANKVYLLDPPRAIGWLTGYDPKGDGHLEFGGWFWRYDLAPLGPSETEVTLTYDWSAVPQSIREHIQFPPFGPRAPQQLTAPLGRACRSDIPAALNTGGGLRIDYATTTADDLAAALRTTLAQNGTGPGYRKVPRGGADRAAARIAALLAGQ